MNKVLAKVRGLDREINHRRFNFVFINAPRLILR